MMPRKCAAVLGAIATLMLSSCMQPSAGGMAQQVDGAPVEEASDLPLVAFVGGSVISTDPLRVLPDQTVITRGDRIEAVGHVSQLAVPESARRIDAHGRFLVAGLVDMHVHFQQREQISDLLLYLANGVTTVRNMHATDGAPILRWRDEVVRGERSGPMIYSTGPTLSTLTSRSDVERALAEHRRVGYDFLKVYSPLSADRYLQLMATAAREGIPVVGHVPVAVGVAGALAAGQRTLEHVEDLYQVHFGLRPDTAALPELISTLRTHDACVVPTLVVFGRVVDHFEQFPDLKQLMARPELRYVHPAVRRLWAPELNTYVRRNRRHLESMPAIAARVRRDHDFMKFIVAALDAADVRLAVGTDANVPHTIPGFSMADELRILVEEVGLTPARVLHAATAAAAGCMGKEDEFGTIRPGLRADLLLLEANPLSDIRNLERRVGVMAQGRWYPAAELRQFLDELRDR